MDATLLLPRIQLTQYHIEQSLLFHTLTPTPAPLPLCPSKVAPAEGFSDLAMQVMTSPSKNYILAMICLGVCVLFLFGLLCGRITKRVMQEQKNR